MKKLELIINETLAGCSVEQLLRQQWHMASGTISSLKFRPQALLLNGKKARSTTLVRKGDVLWVDIADHNKGNPAQPMAYPLHFLYEDDYLAVLDKPHGMAVHGSLQGGACTVANALSALWGREQSFHPVNRLDKGTGGLMLIAKCGFVHDTLRRALHSKDFVREYKALCQGRVQENYGNIILPLGKGEGTLRCVDENGEPAHTEFWVLERYENATLLRLRLHTGRTHQIRVHLSAISHPIWGDVLYGGEPASCSPSFALESVYVRFRHPITGEVIERENVGILFP